MFEFAFVMAISLLGTMIMTYYYFNDKIENKQKEAESEYAKEVAKICKESYRGILQEYTKAPASPSTLEEFLESMEKFWIDATSAQFKKLYVLTKASKPRVYLHDTMSAFTSAVILLLLTGLFPYLDLIIYSLPLLIIATVTIIIGSVRFWQMLKTLQSS